MSEAGQHTPRILHCLPAGAGDVTLHRIREVVAGLGAGLRHEFVVADGADPAELLDALAALGVRPANGFPEVRGGFGPRRFARLAKAMQPYGLVFSYGWPAIDLAMAHTLFCDSMSLPQLFHHEDGEGWDARREAGVRRKWYRRLAFGKIDGIVVATSALASFASEEWQQPKRRIHNIPTAIDTVSFDRPARLDALRVRKREGEHWAGLIAPLDRSVDWSGVIEAFNALPEQWHLVIVGEGRARDAILSAAAELEISHRVHLPGTVRDRAEALALFDMYLLPPGGSTQTLGVLEAMAAGLPLAGHLPAALADLPCDANRELLAGANGKGGLANGLKLLAEDTQLRRKLGEANRERARAQFDRSQMVERYRGLVAAALGREF
ncbi:glycosyltransferase family 4 protein [Altererythrobacter litoralis]|uniref:Glycosyltransferase family 4 protein n=1 Tax=Altererythrobacter litoralis TaxID=3113904 RepID=A0ABU7GF96_9SPHN|nr:glycosyltransferase family 4 protein [Erythrobacteraceae bacterium 1XM1-14]